jgi:cytochrome c551/c552
LAESQNDSKLATANTNNNNNNTSNATTVSVVQDSSNHRKRLMDFYTKYEPAKATDAQVSKLLEKYSGREEELFSMLADKYASGSSNTNNNNNNNLSVPQESQQNNNNNNNTSALSLSQRRVSTATAEPAVSHHERLMRFYTVFEPSKANDDQIDRILVKYEGREEEQLWPMLMDKYGPEPTDDQVAEAKNRPHGLPAPSPKTPNIPLNENKTSFDQKQLQQLPADQRLFRFYEFYDPSKATSDQISKVLAKYQGKEDQLFQMLVDKYGPEPTTSTSTAAPVTGNNNNNNNNNTAASAPVPPLSHRERLLRFYGAYDPSKANEDQIEKILIKYEGREDQLWAMLIDKYGPEPKQQSGSGSGGGGGAAIQQNVSQAPSSSTVLQPTTAPANLKNNDASPTQIKERLFRFYSIHEPAKANDDQLSKVLTKYSGKEDTLFLMLTDKYQCKEPTDAEWNQYLQQQQKQNLNNSGPLSPLAMKTENNTNNNNNNNNNTNNNNSASLSSSSATYDRLKRFYLQYEPAKANDEQLGKVLAKYAGKEDQLFQMLIDKYGPEPGAFATTTSSASAPNPMSPPLPVAASNVASSASTNYYDRLRRFYQQYDPSKATEGQMSKILAKYEGKEGQLFEMLVEKYGPEPSASSNSNNNNNNNNSSAVPKSTRDRLMSFYQKYEPSKANDEQISKIMAKYEGREDQLFQMLIEKYGPE